jgi:NDP-sugar pyrophosphorylase family protein
MPNTKFALTNTSKTSGNVTVFRIKCLDAFTSLQGTVHAGELGGWVQSEDNLQTTGNAWIADEAVVKGNARVKNHAYVGGNAIVQSNAIIMNSGFVSGNALVKNHAVIKEQAEVIDNAVIQDNAIMEGTSQAGENCTIKDDAQLLVHANVSGHCIISGIVEGTVVLFDNVTVTSTGRVSGSCFLGGTQTISTAIVCG